MLKVRDFAELDREIVSAIYVDSRKFGFPFLEASQFKNEDFERDTEGEVILVAEFQHKIVGFASYVEEKSFLHNLYLDPKETGKGFGQAFFHNIIQRTGGSLSLKCVVKNYRALAFYQKLGMAITDEGETDAGKHYILEYSA